MVLQLIQPSQLTPNCSWPVPGAVPAPGPEDVPVPLRAEAAALAEASLCRLRSDTDRLLQNPFPRGALANSLLRSQQVPLLHSELGPTTRPPARLLLSLPSPACLRGHSWSSGHGDHGSPRLQLRAGQLGPRCTLWLWLLTPSLACVPDTSLLADAELFCPARGTFHSVTAALRAAEILTHTARPRSAFLQHTRPWDHHLTGGDQRSQSPATILQRRGKHVHEAPVCLRQQQPSSSLNKAPVPCPRIRLLMAQESWSLPAPEQQTDP